MTRVPALRLISHLALVMLTVAPIAVMSAQTNAKLSYSVVHRQLEVLQEVGQLDKILARMVISSTVDGVAPKDITLSLNDGSTVHYFTIDDEGIVEFPLREDWNFAGYVVETNQPAGTLKLDTSFGIKRLKAKQLPYRLLMDPVNQIRQALIMQAGMTGETAPQVTGLVLHFTPGAATSVSIASGSGEKLYSSAGNDLIRLEMEEDLVTENPIVSFEHLPVSIQPWLR